MLRFLMLVLVAVGAYAQKSVSAPRPFYTATNNKFINVGAPTIHVPKKIPQLIDVPHTPLQMPRGGAQIQDVHLDIPQPVISMPKPIIQRKPVIYNVPQPIIQVPQPIIRHRPVLYVVPHKLKLQRPVVSHNEEHYNVPSASVAKSGYSS